MNLWDRELVEIQKRCFEKRSKNDEGGKKVTPLPEVTSLNARRQVGGFEGGKTLPLNGGGGSLYFFGTKKKGTPIN